MPPDIPSTSRVSSKANSSARTLDRRGSDEESEDETIVIDRRKGFNSRKVENAQDRFSYSIFSYFYANFHVILIINLK